MNTPMTALFFYYDLVWSRKSPRALIQFINTFHHPGSQCNEMDTAIEFDSVNGAIPRCCAMIMEKKLQALTAIKNVGSSTNGFIQTHIVVVTVTE
jgi:hypothetical protein